MIIVNLNVSENWSERRHRHLADIVGDGDLLVAAREVQAGGPVVIVPGLFCILASPVKLVVAVGWILEGQAVALVHRHGALCVAVSEGDAGLDAVAFGVEGLAIGQLAHLPCNDV